MRKSVLVILAVMVLIVGLSVKKIVTNNDSQPELSSQDRIASVQNETQVPETLVDSPPVQSEVVTEDYAVQESLSEVQEANIDNTANQNAPLVSSSNTNEYDEVVEQFYANEGSVTDAQAMNRLAEINAINEQQLITSEQGDGPQLEYEKYTEIQQHATEVEKDLLVPGQEYLGTVNDIDQPDRINSLKDEADRNEEFLILD